MFILTLKSLDEANVILTGLAELPAKHSIGLINEIRSQIQKQVDEQNKPVEPAPAPANDA